MHIISREIESICWNKLYSEYKFKPGIDSQNEWIKIPDESKTYHKNIPCEYEYYDYGRKCQVYFPTYYPNGDYHLFFDKDWTSEESDFIIFLEESSNK